jgi:ribonucleotide reductase beta subunit family protein with ferritin-like domain
MANNNETELFLTPTNDRLVMFPIKYPDIWKMYKDACASVWFVEEIDFNQDLTDWGKLTENEQYFISMILGFFAASDGIVNENLCTRFYNEIQIPEARAFYSFQAMIETVHCVSGKTKILTDKGYFNIEDLENTKVNVWNGGEFSNVEIKYTGNAPLYKVKLSNGMDLDCTDGHKWLMRTGNQKHPESCKLTKIETKNLKIDDIIYKYEVPVIDIPDQDKFMNPYIHGFFCGDGSYCNNYPSIALYGEKKKLLEYFDPKSTSTCQDPIKFYITDKINKDKYFVPINYSIDTKLQWLEGYCDADGCISYNGTKDATSIQITSINYTFLKEVQLMMSTIGILTNFKLSREEKKMMLPKNDGTGDYAIYDTKNIYILYITCKDVNKLIKLGFSPKRLKTLYCERLETGPNTQKLTKIEEITKISDDEKTYCFNEPINHTGIFNGILTGQSEGYSLMIDTYIKDPKEKHRLLHAVDTIPSVREKADWALKWIEDKESTFAIRLVAFAIIEGIFFSGAFCSIYWLKERGVMPGLTFANELVAKDESLHTLFAVKIYSHLQNKLSQETIHNIVSEAVEIETKFIIESIPCNLLGMNSILMTNYIQFIADRLLLQLGCDKLFDVTNPFPFMDRIGLANSSNFFESRVAEYNRASLVMGDENGKIEFSTEADF